MGTTCDRKQWSFENYRFGPDTKANRHACSRAGIEDESRQVMLNYLIDAPEANYLIGWDTSIEAKWAGEDKR